MINIEFEKKDVAKRSSIPWATICPRAMEDLGAVPDCSHGEDRQRGSRFRNLFLSELSNSNTNQTVRPYVFLTPAAEAMKIIKLVLTPVTKCNLGYQKYHHIKVYFMQPSLMNASSPEVC